MIAKATAKYIRCSPTKVRQVIALVKGKGVNQALAILANTKKRAAHFIEETLKSAIANAKVKTQGKLTQDKLIISKITADGGYFLKRFKAQAMGRATRIRRRTSHINIELEETKQRGA